MKARWLACTAVLDLCLGVCYSAPVPSFRGLGDLDGGRFDSTATDISSDGSVVVGSSGMGKDFQREAFRWTPAEGMVSLGDLPGGTGGSTAFAVSADGSVVVGDGHGRQAFRWAQETGMVGLERLSDYSVYSRALGVSADGSVIAGFDRPDHDNKAVLWTEGGISLIAPAGYTNSSAVDISANGEIVVLRADDESMLWTEAGGFVVLPGGPHANFSGPYSISSDGTAVVGMTQWHLSEGDWEMTALRWTADEGTIDLEGPLADSISWSVAYGASNNGSVVVGSGRWESSESHAFIWEADHGMRKLQDVLVNDHGLDLTGWELHRARDISDDGLTLVGWGYNPNGDREAWIAIIPEPATLSLLAFGALAAIWHRNKKS